MLERWTRRVLRRRFLVLAAWLAVAIAGIVAAAHLGPLLSNSLAVPGSESDRARLRLEAHYGERPDGTFTVVVPDAGRPAASPRRTTSADAFAPRPASSPTAPRRTRAGAAGCSTAMSSHGSRSRTRRVTPPK